MNSSSKTALFLGALAVAMISSVSSAVIKSGDKKVSPIIGQESDWQIIGEIGRKTYYTNNVATNPAVTNWFGARDRCRSAGLEFADFQSREEFSFVRGQLGSIQLWVSASLRGIEDYSSQQNFVWADGSTVSREISFHHWSYNWLCLLFSSDDHLYTTSCLEGRFGTLCQAVNA